MKVMKVMNGYDEFFRFDDKCDEFLGLTMDFNVFNKVSNMDLFNQHSIS